MAKRDLAVSLRTSTMWAGVTAAAVIALVESLNAALAIMHERFDFDSGALLGQLGGPLAVIGLFFDQLRTEFDALSRLLRVLPVPGAEMSLIFAAVSALAAYVWMELAKRREWHRTELVPLAVLAVTAFPLLLSVLSLTTA